MCFCGYGKHTAQITIFHSHVHTPPTPPPYSSFFPLLWLNAHTFLFFVQKPPSVSAFEACLPHPDLLLKYTFMYFSTFHCHVISKSIWHFVIYICGGVAEKKSYVTWLQHVFLNQHVLSLRQGWNTRWFLRKQTAKPVNQSAPLLTSNEMENRSKAVILCIVLSLAVAQRVELETFLSVLLSS